MFRPAFGLLTIGQRRPTRTRYPNRPNRTKPESHRLAWNKQVQNVPAAASSNQFSRPRPKVGCTCWKSVFFLRRPDSNMSVAITGIRTPNQGCNQSWHHHDHSTHQRPGPELSVEFDIDACWTFVLMSSSVTQAEVGMSGADPFVFNLITISASIIHRLPWLVTPRKHWGSNSNAFPLSLLTQTTNPPQGVLTFPVSSKLPPPSPLWLRIPRAPTPSGPKRGQSAPSSGSCFPAPSLPSCIASLSTMFWSKTTSRHQGLWSGTRPRPIMSLACCRSFRPSSPMQPSRLSSLPSVLPWLQWALGFPGRHGQLRERRDGPQSFKSRWRTGF